MKKTNLLVLAVALVAIALAPKPAFADAAQAPSAVSAPATVDNGAQHTDAKFVDGNWFQIADAAGEEYKTGSPTNLALNDQIDKYNEAVSNHDDASAEQYAIRSWVKSLYAANQGLTALEAKDYALAKHHLNRAIRLAKRAQRDGAGLGEAPDRVNDDSAQQWKGTSKVEGARAQAYAEKLLARVQAASGSN